jgi:hypothetical protein
MAEKKEGDDERLHPLMKYLLDLADTTSCSIVNAFYQAMIEATVLYNPQAKIDPLPEEGMSDRLRSAVPKAAPGLANWLDSIGKDRSMKEISNDDQVRGMFLIELIRCAYSGEMLIACKLPEEVWTKKKNEVVECAQRYGVKFDPSTWKVYFEATEDKAKSMAAKRGRSKEEMEARAKKKAAKRKAPARKQRSLFDEYIRSAATSRIEETVNLGVYTTTAFGYLAMASMQIDPEKLLKMENEIITNIALFKAAMVMTKPMLEEFAKKCDVTSQQLMASVGTMIVHRPDDAKVEDIDKAIKQFLSENQDSFESRIGKWNPEALEAMRKQGESQTK